MMIAGFSVVITSGRRLFKMLGGEERDVLLEGLEENGLLEKVDEYGYCEWIYLRERLKMRERQKYVRMNDQPIGAQEM